MRLIVMACNASLFRLRKRYSSKFPEISTTRRAESPMPYALLHHEHAACFTPSMHQALTHVSLEECMSQLAASAEGLQCFSHGAAQSPTGWATICVPCLSCDIQAFEGFNVYEGSSLLPSSLPPSPSSPPSRPPLRIPAVNSGVTLPAVAEKPWTEKLGLSVLAENMRTLLRRAASHPQEDPWTLIRVCALIAIACLQCIIVVACCCSGRGRRHSSRRRPTKRASYSSTPWRQSSEVEVVYLGETALHPEEEENGGRPSMACWCGLILLLLALYVVVAQPGNRETMLDVKAVIEEEWEKAQHLTAAL